MSILGLLRGGLSAPLWLGGGSRGRRPGLVTGAAAGIAILLSAVSDAQTYSLFHTFTVPPSSPVAALIQGSDGNFYGTAQYGGGKGAGTVFRMDSSGSVTVLHTFSGDDGAAPLGPLLEFGGFFYGTTSLSGAHDAGTVFKVDGSGNFATLHAFAGTAGSEGANPQCGLVRAGDGNFYGTTLYGGAGLSNLGTVFKMDPSGTVTTLRSFSGSDGDLPYGGLVLATDGKFYGTTSGGGSGGAGTIFRIDSAGGSFLTLHPFVPGTDGGDIRAPLIQASDGKLYGTAYGGGANGSGTVFRADTGGSFLKLHDFTASEGGAVWAPVAQGGDGKLYGTTEIGGTSTQCNGFSCGTAYRIDTGGTNFATLHSFDKTDGSLPYGGLVPAADGNFYGVTTAGGAADGGTAFKMTPAGAVTTLHSFGGTGSGNEPEAAVMQASDGNFYGTTYRGGTSNQGTIFKLDGAGNYTLLHSFTGADGANPQGALVQASDGKLYGTTVSGGTPGNGTVFRIDTAGTTLTTLHNFSITDGDSPKAGLALASDGKMYGTTSDGGTNLVGTLFRVDTAGTFATLHNFISSEAAIMVAPLVQGTDGNLYGASSSGGSLATGTVFRATLAGAVTALHEFADAEGTSPGGGLIQAPDGNFYGTTRTGGANGFGTVYRVTTGGSVTDLHDFVAADGYNSLSSLLRASDGKLYGTAYSGGPGGRGTLFRIDAAGTNFAVVHGFAGPDGGGVAAPVIQATDGALYGTANQGGFGAAGVVYKEVLCTPPAVSASSSSPVCAGTTLMLSATTIPGATYAWTGPNGFTSALQNPTISSVTFAASGVYSVVATVAGCASAPATTTVVVRGPSAAITAPASVCASSTGNPASVPSAGAGATYVWGITNGTITAGAGTASITFTAGASGSVQLSVTVTDANGCVAMNSVSVPITVCTAMQFHTLTPCRMADTRNPAGPLGGPALAANATRNFTLTGVCGLPATARAVSVNLTITSPTAAGDLRLFPAGTPLPLVSAINYRAGQTRANNAVASLGTGGAVSVRCDQAAGTVQFILDVNGYFE